MNTKVNKRVTAVLLIFIFLFAVLSFTACSPQKRPAPAPDQQMPAPGPDTTPQATEDNKKADMLASKISDMTEVNSATVVLADTRAWVGVDLKAETNLTNTVKDKIIDMVKKEDKNIQSVYVTADADTVTRLRNIARDIASGRPLSGFIDELNEIGNRIMPMQK